MKLYESGLNPRCEFDQAGIDELAKSIAQVGILQPLVVRKHPTPTKNGAEMYEVVCGARRLSAAVVADLKEVPAIVRELSDDEAFDLMITENLQRKDVSCMEEANAFMKLINTGKYDVDSLCARFGKSQHYIKQRIKLNDLILEFQKLVSNDTIGIGHALEICKLEHQYQTELYEKHYSDEERSHSYWSPKTVASLKRFIEREFTLKLSEAAFDTTDASLYPSAGACITCHKNTASDTILFPDGPETGLCLDAQCFKKKVNIHLKRELNRIQDEQPDVIIGMPSYVYGDEEKDLKSIKSEGIHPVEISFSNGFFAVNRPDVPTKPEIADFGQDEVDDFQDALSEYEDEIETYQEDLKDYEEMLASGNLRKVFMAVGDNKGKILHYELRENVHQNGATGENISEKKQVEELEEKDKRNAEIAFEKTYLDAKKLLEDNSYSNEEFELTQLEWQAVYTVLLSNIGYCDLRTELNPNANGYFDNKVKAAIVAKLNIKQINRLFRAFIKKMLDNSTPNDLISDANALIQVAGEFYPQYFTEIELKHQGVYLKRKEAIEKKINELKSQNP